MKLNTKRDSARTVADYMDYVNNRLFNMLSDSEQKIVDTFNRTLMSCMLWENEFYESGESIADRIYKSVGELREHGLDIHAYQGAVKARKESHLRHAPLLVIVAMIQHGYPSNLIEDAIVTVCTRADMMGELIKIYWKNGKQPLTNAMRRGIARAFQSFGEFELAKYNSRNADITLRDVMFLTHPTPPKILEDVYKDLANKTLKSADTWEVALSAGADKKETFTRLLEENKLGYFALIRNIRNMENAGVDTNLICKHIKSRRGADKILPFRFVAAYNNTSSMQIKEALEFAFKGAVEDLPYLSGRTAVLVDVSGSMENRLSAKSDMTRSQAAAALATLVKGDNVTVFTFADNVKIFSIDTTLGLRDVSNIIHSDGGGTDLYGAISSISPVSFDRLICITDEQDNGGWHYINGRRSYESPLNENIKNYVINVASYKNGIKYDNKAVSINGFSENVLIFIHSYEN